MVQSQFLQPRVLSICTEAHIWAGATSSMGIISDYLSKHQSTQLPAPSFPFSLPKGTEKQMLFLVIHEARPQKSPEQIHKLLSKQLDFEFWFGFTPKAGAQKHLLNISSSKLNPPPQNW